MKNLALLSGFVTNAIDGIIIIDELGTISTINPSGCKMFGYSPDEIIGNNIRMLMPPPDREQHDGYLKRYHDTGTPRIIGIGREVLGLKKDGARFPLKLGVSEVRYKDVIVYVGFLHDLSQQKKDEAQLKEYALHLEELVEKRTQSLNETIHQLELAKELIGESLEREKELGKLKSRFVSMASHEFRTPLHALQLSAALIGKYADPLESPEIQKHVLKIKNSVGHLTSILNDFLNLEKLESGKVTAQFMTFDLKNLMADLTSEMQLLSKPGQVLHFSHTGEPMAFLDQNLVRNCVLNLISNAIKYSSDGNIEITSEIADSGCRIEVRDNGIGIGPEEQEHMFEPFFRAANATLIAGTGLGLTIVSRYVGLMGGKVEFSSTPNVETVFTLTFPKYEKDNIGH
ncbi:MAG: PAS domain S-box protein [Flavobacterium sp.]|nr:MAG: PAS domain S-box protein [Flavobacterium sp.]